MLSQTVPAVDRALSPLSRIFSTVPGRSCMRSAKFDPAEALDLAEEIGKLLRLRVVERHAVLRGDGADALAQLIVRERRELVKEIGHGAEQLLEL